MVLYPNDMIAPMMLAHQKCSRDGSCDMKIWMMPKMMASCRQEGEASQMDGLLCHAVVLVD